MGLKNRLHCSWIESEHGSLNKKLLLVFLLGCSFVSPLLALEPQRPSFSTASSSPLKIPNRTKYRGWEFLVAKLKALGIPEADLNAVYQNPRMPRFTTVRFSLEPKERPEIYRHFLDTRKVKKAVEFIKGHRTILNQAEQRFGVDCYTVAAILLIESDFGQVTGKHLAVNRLSRLASAGHPINVKLNYQRLHREDPAVTLEAVEARARYLEETFLPELPALFEVARRRNLRVLGIRGSSAGAFGLPQFLPTSYIKFGIDGNRDGVVSLFTVSDAINSCANFLASYGWRESASEMDKRRALMKYNRSEAYVDTVLKVADKARKLS